MVGKAEGTMVPAAEVMINFVEEVEYLNEELTYVVCQGGAGWSGVW